MRLHTYEWGDRNAPPVVCVHGVTAHALRFRRLAEERLARRFRVLSVDLRGHGRSAWEPPWDLETHVADLLDTADAHDVGRAAWIGHSFGGRLVLELAARAPGRVERAVLLDPAIWVPPSIALERAEEHRADVSFATADEAIAARRELSPAAPEELLREEMDQHLVRGEDGRLRHRYCRSAVVAAYAEMAKPPPLDRLDGLAAQIVRAPEAGICPDAVVEVYGEHVPGLEVVDVPHGHIVLWEAFEETAGAVERFLDV